MSICFHISILKKGAVEGNLIVNLQIPIFKLGMKELLVLFQTSFCLPNFRKRCMYGYTEEIINISQFPNSMHSTKARSCEDNLRFNPTINSRKSKWIIEIKASLLLAVRPVLNEKRLLGIGPFY